MKWKLFAAGLTFAGLALAADTAQVVDEIVAKVNGDIVSRDELQRISKELAQELQAQGEKGSKFDQDYSQHEKDILRDRIDELLLVQRGKELNINVDSEISKYMAGLQREQAANNPALSDPEKFHDFVRQQSGMSWEDFQQQTRNSFLKRRVIGDEVARRISVSHQEIENFYNQHQKDFVRDEKVFLSEILVSAQGKTGTDAAALKKATDLAARAGKGERFTDLARDNSDSTTAKQGGELGGYKRGDLKKDLEDQVWNLPKGAVTKPIKIENGYLILKVDDHTKEGLAQLSDVEAQIQEALYAPKMEPKVRDYLKELRKTAFLQIKSGYVDSGAVEGQDTRWQDPATLKPETITKAQVQEKTRRKRLFGVVPIPGTQTTVTGKSSSR